MEKTYCDICLKEFKWYNNWYYIGSYDKRQQVCSKCQSKVDAFIKQLKKEAKKQNDN